MPDHKIVLPPAGALQDVALPGGQRKPGARAGLALAAAVLLAAPLVFDQPFYLHLAILVCINVVIVSGLSLLTRAGQVSLCHGAFVGLGAYAAALLVMRGGMPFVAGAAVAMLAAGAVAFLLGAIILRLTGVYFVLITFAFGELVRLGLLEWESVTGGANGITGIPPAALFGFAFESKSAFYCLAAAVAAACVAFLWVLFRSPAGHAIDAVGENAALAEASGVSVRGTQLFAFTAGSALAGLGGALTAHYLGYISPESFNVALSTAVIIMLVVGGRSFILGPVVGALVMTPLPELFRGAVESQNIFYGVALILMLRFLPQGLAGLAQRRRGARQ
ncbi:MULTISPECIES: branched-chain amino acid ABC transporter permease [Cupriavidus]|uniref:branched-chain amino acid ABC transporter permease n=1 Tax=Cupriavidus TaxID=106589 RepID=UPI00035EE569|nr:MULTISPECIES: branched-chain amino acid ABC transporter permease [Cupriavidus]